MRRCEQCARVAAIAETHCRRCGTALIVPPSRWAVIARNVLLGFAALTFPLQVHRLLSQFEVGRACLASGEALLRYVYTNGADIAGIVFAFVVAPGFALFVAFRAMIDIGDRIDLKVQEWRTERFRKHGW